MFITKVEDFDRVARFLCEAENPDLAKIIKSGGFTQSVS